MGLHECEASQAHSPVEWSPLPEPLDGCVPFAWEGWRGCGESCKGDSLPWAFCCREPFPIRPTVPGLAEALQALDPLQLTPGSP